jgi:hypothetical protein
LAADTPVLIAKRCRCEIGQDGGKRASYPGYCVGSFMAGKRFARMLPARGLAGAAMSDRREKGGAVGVSGKMFCPYPFGGGDAPPIFEIFG